MSNESVYQYLNSIRDAYRKAKVREKSKILDVAVLATPYTRKYIIRLLGEKPTPGAANRAKRGRKLTYGPECLPPLKALWLLMEQPSGQKMQALIPHVLPAYLKRQRLDAKIVALLREMSAATIDRLLAPCRVERGLSTTKAPTSHWYKSAIPVQPKDWNVTKPGHMQADTVSHCGEDASGAFASTLTTTDIDSHWTEMRATFTKKAGGIVAALLDIERSLPFALDTIKFDSGSEFMNHDVINALLRTGPDHRAKPVEIFRSRPYRKNDNCYVEQKNLTHVRQFIGYDRIESQGATRCLNELYRDLWCPFLNFFMPTFKLLRKERIGSRIKKTYEKPRTPYERILASDAVPNDVKARLKLRYESLDPIELKHLIEEKLKLFFAIIREEEKSEKLKLAA